MDIGSSVQTAVDGLLGFLPTLAAALPGGKAGQRHPTKIDRTQA